MASTWGDSWSSVWGDSWGAVTESSSVGRDDGRVHNTVIQRIDEQDMIDITNMILLSGILEDL